MEASSALVVRKSVRFPRISWSFLSLCSLFCTYLYLRSNLVVYFCLTVSLTWLSFSGTEKCPLKEEIALAAFYSCPYFPCSAKVCMIQASTSQHLLVNHQNQAFGTSIPICLYLTLKHLASNSLGWDLGISFSNAFEIILVCIQDLETLQ